MNVYTVKWSVPVPNTKTYETYDLQQTFRHKRTAVRFKNQLTYCYEFLGFNDAQTYVRLITEEVL